MSGHGSSTEKGVNTSLICQESYACGGSDEAAFECNECQKLQCIRCEAGLHSQEHQKSHERVPIGPGHVPYCDSCRGSNGSSEKKNRSVIRCLTCKLNLCQDCQKRTHSGGNKRKHPVTAYPPPPKLALDNSVQTPAQTPAPPPAQRPTQTPAQRPTPTPAQPPAQTSVQTDNDNKAQAARLLENVASFLLVDENEEMQVSHAKYHA